MCIVIYLCYLLQARLVLGNEQNVYSVEVINEAYGRQMSENSNTVL